MFAVVSCESCHRVIGDEDRFVLTEDDYYLCIPCAQELVGEGDEE